MCNTRRDMNQLASQQAYLSFKTTMTAATKWNRDLAASPFIPVFLVSQIMFCPIVRRAKYNQERLPSITPRLLSASLWPGLRVWHNPVSPDHGGVGHCQGCNAGVIPPQHWQHITREERREQEARAQDYLILITRGPEAREFDETQ